MDNPRQLAFVALRDVHKGAYADVALDRVLRKNQLSNLDRRLLTELVYGSVRRMRSLDAIIDQLAKKKAHQQPPDLRTLLHLGLYQLRYLNHIPASAAVNSTVGLAKENRFSGLSGFVNGLLRQYIRLAAGERRSPLLPPYLLSPEGTPSSPKGTPTPPLRRGEARDEGEESQLFYAVNDPLQLPENPVARLGILHSYPDWIIEVWLEQLSLAETEQLCMWLNQPPAIDLRINTLRTSIEMVAAAMQSAGVSVSSVPPLPQALRLTGSIGSIQNLPGFNEGWWTVQDSSAQLVSYLLAPQPGETVIDACAAPGGKTTHIAELMQDQGTVLACDRTASRLRKLKENATRLQLQCIQTCVGDSRISDFKSADRLLLDVPCSGLGTLHRHADARWRQTPESVQELTILQSELLSQTSKFVKVGGILVYATCTLNPLENEGVIQLFLNCHPNWQIEPPVANSPAFAFTTSEGFVKVLPHRHSMDGFFMVRLRKESD